MKTKDKTDLIARYLAGEADDSEINELTRWVSQTDENRRQYTQIKNIWEVSGKSVARTKIDTGRALESVRSRMKQGNTAMRFWYWWQKVAAILVIPVLVGSLYFLFTGQPEKPGPEAEIKQNEVRTAYGNRAELLLSDSTSVILDAKSKLTYPVEFTGNTREVILEGQAYFRVKSDATKPFIVKSKHLQVCATGTTFDVSDYDNKSESQVTLVSGRVSVSKVATDNKVEALAVLEPDQSLTYNRGTNQIAIESRNTYEYIAWKDGKLIFRNEPMEKVVETLSEKFEVDIELKDPDLKEYRYRATFQDEPLSEILKLLKMSSPIDYNELERNPLPDGTFEPRKVIIFRAQKE